MSRDSSEKLKRFNISGIPLIKSVSEMLGLKSIFKKYIPSYGNETVASASALLFLIWNITLGRQPLYELSQWIRGIEPKCHGLDKDQVASFNDDRFARALDKLYAVDRATLMTDIVVTMIKKINLDMGRVHNDSTTVKAYGKIAGVTKDGLRMAKGNNKDKRPDLVHLVFSLTISSDGAIPVHYKTYPGNRTDDTTHIETWNTVKEIAGRSDFIYVADSKVCTSKQLTHIVANGGRVITVMPNTYKETKIFKDKLLSTNIPRKVILKRKIEEGDCNNEYFSLFLTNYETIDDGYTVYWYLSSQKKRLDKHLRQKKLKKADNSLMGLSLKINKRDLRTEEVIKGKVEDILNKYGLKDFFKITVFKNSKEIRKHITKGRPGPLAGYKSITKTTYSLDWEIDKERLKKEERSDGIFPLLSTDKSIGPKEALVSYKYQPRLEKRFNQFKSVHEAAPILFKNIKRVEGVMFLFFVALIVQGIIERKVRMSMKERSIKSLPIYPEYRRSFYPTTSKIFYNFDGISSYKILKNGKVIKEFKDELSSIQKLLLDLLDINEDDFWGK
jgi:transposase